MKKENTLNSEPETLNSETSPIITDNLIKALCELYEPTDTTEGVELKTSIDLMEEMAPIADVEKEEIATAMEKANFKLKYTDAGVFWMLKKK